MIAAMLGGMIGLGVVFIRNMLKEPMTNRRTTSGAAEQWLGVDRVPCRFSNRKSCASPG